MHSCKSAGYLLHVCTCTHVRITCAHCMVVMCTWWLLHVLYLCSFAIHVHVHVFIAACLGLCKLLALVVWPRTRTCTLASKYCRCILFNPLMVLDAHLHVHTRWPSVFGCFVCLCAYGMLRLAEFFCKDWFYVHGVFFFPLFGACSLSLF